MRKLFVVLSVAFSMSMATHPVYAMSYNYSAEGALISIEGMFDCAFELATCDEDNVTNWMFTQVDGVNDGLSFDASTPMVELFTFDPTTGVLDVLIATPGGDYIGVFPDSNFMGSREGDVDDEDIVVSWSVTSKSPPIPEPSTMLLFGTGMAGLGWWRFRKQETA